jgi:hypothetical protein
MINRVMYRLQTTECYLGRRSRGDHYTYLLSTVRTLYVIPMPPVKGPHPAPACRARIFLFSSAQKFNRKEF